MIKKEMSQILQQESRGFGIKEMLTVTIVRMSPDLSFARIYVSVFPSAQAEKAIGTLKSHNSQIRGLLGRNIGKQMRAVPDFSFYLDDSLDYAERIDDLLN